MQLERLLHREGWSSRKGCRILINQGRVCVAGEVADDPGMEVEPEGLAYSVDDEAAIAREHLYLILNKPLDLECSRKPTVRTGVLTLFPPRYSERGVQPVGRLDADTSGLLLLSDDGQFIHRITSPKHLVSKTYVATCARPVEPEHLRQLLAGVVLNDDPAPVVARSARTLDEHTLELVVTEGRYHQVRRMIAAVGNHCDALHRSRIGELVLDGLAPGQWRELTTAELALLG